MRLVPGKAANPPTVIGGPISTHADRSVRKVIQISRARIQFRDLARFAWPHKTEFFLAELTGADPRTCRRWLAEHNEPPADALGVVLCEIMRRFHQRD
ncbi:MAG TPA: hypothetical protein VIM11_26875 [Tepidisphaeraceae bacterium]